ncbi:membrane protein insertion efficiency factor YidD [Pantanalinema sp. GBBB05]|uniref:membrane protein insertion efficiency factor YidD n=1 Tax=Pantanalinema sp. GBBB05 TaxID=2604139 RepID=UPI001D3BE8B5|nr:membrane protein insertion efficiency factor YidD [Pantanalinema sp. GBBB05]
MSISPTDAFTRQTATTLISLYQTRISPHKGFSCAYRVLHRDESCSQYIKRTIQTQGLWQSLPLIRDRFRACKTANQILKQRSQCPTQTTWAAIDDQSLSTDEPIDADNIPADLGQNVTNSQFNRTRQQAGVNSSSHTDCSGCEVLECADCSGLDCDVLGSSHHQCAALDCHGCEWGALDCSSLDCGALDCGALDCGSCSW